MAGRAGIGTVGSVRVPLGRHGTARFDRVGRGKV